MGVQGTVLDWFRSYLVYIRLLGSDEYLEDRYHSVHVSDVSLVPRLLTFGFPQGSHIGPHAF